MLHFKYRISILFILASSSYSQTTISGRFVGLNAIDLDSANVQIKDGTGDTTYLHSFSSKDGSFYLTTDHIGTLMAEFACPKYRTLQVALLCNEPANVNVDVILRNKSDSQNMSGLVLRDTLSLLAKYALLHLNTDRRLALSGEEHRKRRSEGKQDEKQTIDWTKDTQEIEKELVNEKEPVLRQELIMQYDELNALGASSASTDSLKKWILEIPPTSPAWVYHANLAWVSSIVFRLAGIQYVDDIIAQHANRFFRARMLYELVSWASGMEYDNYMDSLITVITDKYPDTKWGQKALVFMPIVHVGDPVPHFELRSMDDSLVVISEKSLLGRVYLIDFWATWCAPCRMEMPFLHKAYEHFKDSGFTIVSISEDDSVKTVSMYRGRKWHMPWENVLLNNQAGRSIANKFGVSGIPFPVLVNKQGKIIALGNELKGENLDIAIQKVISN